MRKVGQAFADARAEAGLTQVEVARLSGVHQSCVSRLEQGNGNATVATMEAVANALGCRLDVRLLVPAPPHSSHK